MNTLEAILSSSTRAKIFTILFGVKPRELHNREIARRAGLSEAAVRRELGKLAGIQLLTSRKDSNRVYYSANEDHPLYGEIHSIVLKTTGLVDVLGRALGEEEIEIAFVFGSIAEGSESPDSDVDLMIVGNLTYKEASRCLSGVREAIERDINPVVMSAGEFIKRRKRGDHFLRSVLQGPRLYVRGGPNELEAVGG